MRLIPLADEVLINYTLKAVRVFKIYNILLYMVNFFIYQ